MDSVLIGKSGESISRLTSADIWLGLTHAVRRQSSVDKLGISK